MVWLPVVLQCEVRCDVAYRELVFWCHGVMLKYKFDIGESNGYVVDFNDMLLSVMVLCFWQDRFSV